MTSVYSSFPGSVRAALDCYHSVSGGELNILSYGEQLDAGTEFPFAPPRDAIAHAALSGLLSISGSDDLQGNDRKIARGDFGYTVEVGSKVEGDNIVEALTADGGTVTMPFEKAPWGPYFGMVEDRFGLARNVTTQDEVTN